MIHDPLCPSTDATESQYCALCHCNLIAKVRADQDMIDYAKHLELDYERTGESWEAGYKMGREHEREKMLTEVSIMNCRVHDYEDGMCHVAIDDLMKMLETP